MRICFSTARLFTEVHRGEREKNLLNLRTIHKKGRRISAKQAETSPAVWALPHQRCGDNDERHSGHELQAGSTPWRWHAQGAVRGSSVRVRQMCTANDEKYSEM